MNTALQASPGELDQDELLRRHEPLVTRSAHRLLARLPSSVQCDDLIQAGRMALLEVAHRYDPARGASFETYAAIRVRGAMLDEIRNTAWMPRSVRDKARRVAQIREQANTAGELPPGDTELANRMGIDIEVYRQIALDASVGDAVSLSDTGVFERVSTEESAHGDRAPEDEVEREEFISALREAIDALPERECQVFRLRSEKGLSLAEIARLLDVSESRVWQLHARAVERLRHDLSPWLVED